MIPLHSSRWNSQPFWHFSLVSLEILLKHKIFPSLGLALKVIGFYSYSASDLWDISIGVHTSILWMCEVLNKALLKTILANIFGVLFMHQILQLILYNMYKLFNKDSIREAGLVGGIYHKIYCKALTPYHCEDCLGKAEILVGQAVGRSRFKLFGRDWNSHSQMQFPFLWGNFSSALQVFQLIKPGYLG